MIVLELQICAPKRETIEMETTSQLLEVLPIVRATLWDDFVNKGLLLQRHDEENHGLNYFMSVSTHALYDIYLR